jgi:hypothetical protein
MSDWSLARTFKSQGQILRYDLRGKGPLVWDAQADD